MPEAMAGAGPSTGRPRPVPGPGCYIVTERLSGESCDCDAAAVARITGVEITYIDWAIAEDGCFENGRWQVR